MSIKIHKPNVDTVISQLDVNLSTRASEETLSSLASEATLLALKDAVDNGLAITGSVAISDGESSLTVDSEYLDVALSTRTSEATLVSLKDLIDQISTPDGRVKISTEPGGIPAGSTAVDVVVDGTVTGNSSTDTTYVITNTKTLSIRRFNGGGTSATGGHVVELFYDPSGTGIGMTLIRVAYVSNAGGNFNFDLNFQAIGDGTRAIRMRRTRSGGGSARISAFWSGLES